MPELALFKKSVTSPQLWNFASAVVFAVAFAPAFFCTYGSRHPAPTRATKRNAITNADCFPAIYITMTFGRLLIKQVRDASAKAVGLGKKMERKCSGLQRQAG